MRGGGRWYGVRRGLRIKGSRGEGEEGTRRLFTCTYRVILRIVRAGYHPVAIAQVVEH